MIRSALLVLIFFSAACFPSGGDDSGGGGGGNGASDGGGSGAGLVPGMYLVVHHTVGSASCLSEGGPVSWSPYFRIVKGPGSFDYEECERSDPASCSPGVRPLLEHANTQEGSGCDCCLNHAENLALPQAGGALRLEFRDWWTDLGLGAVCSYDAAMAYRDESGCRSFEVLVGEPVP